MAGRPARPEVLASGGGSGAAVGRWRSSSRPQPGRLRVGGVASDGPGGHRDEPLPGIGGPGVGSSVPCAVPIPLTPSAPALPSLPPARRRGGSRGRAEAFLRRRAQAEVVEDPHRGTRAF
jgi:hypothetical protein